MHSYPSFWLIVFLLCVGGMPLAAQDRSAEAEDWITRGTRYHNEGRYDEAIQAYTKAIEIFPHLSRYYWYRGTTYFVKQRYRDALADYNRALPDYPQAYENRAYLKYELKDYRGAIEDISLLLGIVEQEKDEHYAFRALCFAALRNFRAACHDYQEAQKLGFKKTPSYEKYCQEAATQAALPADSLQKILDAADSLSQIVAKQPTSPDSAQLAIDSLDQAKVQAPTKPLPSLRRYFWALFVFLLIASLSGAWAYYHFRKKANNNDDDVVS
ncbi:tetratricopeptide repeat protein [Eisenibacter elegans]|uniref:tetratricopeptide repeat protein n=1 Tax=Eisenibacter elegans TaxID=997 RepID=UPI00040F2770|nr:tetratricopeptide repeat protein [Eisenibacter elegans]